MLEIGVQSKNVVSDGDPAAGFRLLRELGFSCVDFSLNGYLTNTDLYQNKRGRFFDRSQRELEEFFAPHRTGAEAAGVRIHQMHMPYPIYLPRGSEELNGYLWNVVAPKSMELCGFLGCRYIVVHGFKLAFELGSEEAEWRRTEEFLHAIAPLARELGCVICVENLYGSAGGRLTEGPCCDARKAAQRIDRFNDQCSAEVLGFCFDTGHANLVGLDFEEFLTTLGSRLKVLHIHDNDGLADLHQIPFVFTRTRENKSSTDWEGFVRGLRAIGFDGVLNFETAPVLTAFPEELREDALRLIARIGRYLGGQISGGDR